jgi:NAD(P)-dependent dehydrogenase (short-subunit alcohol dehydrogenase family)
VARLARKSAVITGAANGISRAPAGVFVAEGGRIVATDFATGAILAVDGGYLAR